MFKIDYFVLISFFQFYDSMDSHLNMGAFYRKGETYSLYIYNYFY